MRSLVSSTLLLVFLLVSSGVADKRETKAKTDKKEEISQEGLLAGTTQGGYGSTQLGGWGAGETGGRSAPLGGSVSQDGSNWKVKITNNAAETYKASFQAIQFDARNKRLNSTPFSMTLKGEQSFERIVRKHPNAKHCNLKILRWKKVG